MVLVALFATGCEKDDSAYNNGLSAPFSVVFHSVPFAVGESIWDNANLIETDRHGRTLYYYEAAPFHMGIARDYSSDSSNICLLVVCQNETEEKVGYYEDVCYRMVQSENYTDEDLQIIKTANDWNKPYNQEKVIETENSWKPESWKKFMGIDDYTDTFYEHVTVDRQYELRGDIVSVMDEGVLCAFREYCEVDTEGDNDNRFVFGMNYLVLFDDAGEPVRWTSFEGKLGDFQEHIIAFKNQ